MDERQEKSILEMGRGAIMERADYEMRAMIRNILDPNTSAKAARKLNITLTFKPGDDRQTIVVECVAKSTAAFRSCPADRDNEHRGRENRCIWDASDMADTLDAQARQDAAPLRSVPGCPGWQCGYRPL